MGGGGREVDATVGKPVVLRAFISSPASRFFDTGNGWSDRQHGRQFDGARLAWGCTATPGGEGGEEGGRREGGWL